MKSPVRLLMIFVLLAGMHQAIAQVAFNLVSSPPVGNSPRSVVAADVNGDGKMDLISADYFVDTLSVLTNNGSVGFTLSASLRVYGFPGYPSSVAAADVNGDGKVDLISANSGSTGRSLSVFTNNGSGIFGSNATINLNTETRFVIAADMNEDGKVDLISANYVNRSFSVLTNDGSGAFVLALTTDVSGNPQWITAADMNGDGKVDLILPDTSDNTLLVFTNNGNVGFALAASPGVGSFPLSVAATDVNGDGKVDLISANEGDNTLSVLTNNGSGNFALASSPSVGSQPVCVTAADVNGDGKVDLISANSDYFQSTLSVLTNNGSGGFVLASSPSVGSQPVSVTAADVNGDGKVDLISANEGDNTLSVLINTSTFPPPKLTINRSGNSVIVSWPSAWTNWTLQQNSDLVTTNWTNFSGTVGDDGVTKSVTNSASPGNKFFRLMHP